MNVYIHAYRMLKTNDNNATSNTKCNLFKIHMCTYGMYNLIGWTGGSALLVPGTVRE